jgi:signal peptide peptidase SppA
LKAILSAVDDVEIDGESLHLNTADDFEVLASSLGERVDGTRYARTSGSIGTLSIYGPIIPRASMMEKASGLVSIENLSRDFSALEADRSITDIVLVMDTPGGVVTGVSEFAEMISQSEKNVLSHIVGMAASAGYWIASSAKRVTSTNTGIAGSIGVVTTIIDDSKYLEKRGIKEFDIVSSQTPRKRTDLTTAEGRTELQNILDGIADVFINSVAKGRGVDVETVLKDFGQGAEFVASEGLRRKMLDEIVSTAGLFDSLKADNKSLFGVAATSDNPTENEPTTQEREMANQEPAVASPVTPESVTASQAVAPDLEKIKTEAANAERERLQAIEAIAGKFKKYDSRVQAKVRETIDAMKYEAGATEESVMSAVFQAVVDAQHEIMSSVSNARNELNEQVAQLPNQDAPQSVEDPDKPDPTVVAEIVAGINSVPGR